MNIREHHAWAPCTSEALEIPLAWRCWCLPQQEAGRVRSRVVSPPPADARFPHLLPGRAKAPLPPIPGHAEGRRHLCRKHGRRHRCEGRPGTAQGEQPCAWGLQARPGAGGRTRSPPATGAAGGEPPPCCGRFGFLCKYSNGISLKMCFEQHFGIYMRGNTCKHPASFSG